MSDTVAGLLVGALEAFEHYEDEEALLLLLEAWRESRTERLAWLAERLTGLVACNPDLLMHGPFGDPGRLALHLSVESPRLLDLTGNLLNTRRGDPADPRLTGAMLAFAAQPWTEQEKLFLPLCELFIHMKDPRALVPLRALLAKLPPGSPYARQLGLTLELMETEELPLSAEASARCEALEGAMARREQAVTRESPLRDELLLHIGAHPKDDEARLVLADHLLEQGDPLGQFIALQCQPGQGGERSIQLRNLHLGRWSALLGPGVAPQGTWFERGLPSSVEMRAMPGQVLPPPGPFWCAVQRLDWNGRDDEVLADWLAHPNLRNVKVLTGVPLRLAAKLGTHPLPVNMLALTGDGIRVTPGLFNSLAALPHLKDLSVERATPEDVQLVASSLLARRLKYVVLDGGTWRLSAGPVAMMPLVASLDDQARCDVLAEVIRAAEGFGTQSLQINLRCSLANLAVEGRRLLTEASAAYAHVEWVHMTDSES